jgi:hypothetical protein
MRLPGGRVMNNKQRQIASQIFSDIARELRSGQRNTQITIGLTTVGSEIEIMELVAGAQEAQNRVPGLKVVVIGDVDNLPLPSVKAKTDEEVARILDEMLGSGEIQGAVAMHYPFPIGVATVGKIITPYQGKNMYIATTTGTSDTNRLQAMIKNAVLGIAVAKADGVENPTVGILNVEGARQVERHLNIMQSNGFAFTWGETQRQDKGCIQRGNDLIRGSVDVLVTDSLTGNIIMKVFSAYCSGGNYEVLGYGYGPGVGKDFERIICILSRASGKPVVSGAIEYCAAMVRGNLVQIAQEELNRAEKAGLTIPDDQEKHRNTDEAEVIEPPSKVVDCQIAGIEIFDLDDAVKTLWKNSIFASSGMGCTGPVVMVAGEDYAEATRLLKEAGYI